MHIWLKRIHKVIPQDEAAMTSCKGSDERLKISQCVSLVNTKQCRCTFHSSAWSIPQFRMHIMFAYEQCWYMVISSSPSQHKGIIWFKAPTQIEKVRILTEDVWNLLCHVDFCSWWYDYQVLFQTVIMFWSMSVNPLHKSKSSLSKFVLSHSW